MPKLKNGRGGFTLVEVLVALGVLSIGGLATLQLIGVLIGGNNSMSANIEATTLANQTIAQISLARFIPNDPNNDQGLVAGALYTAPVGGNSVITTVGLFDPNGQPVATINDNPRYSVSYAVANCTTCSQPSPGAAALQGPGGVEVVVEVDNALADGPLFQPVRMVIRKTFSSSAAPLGQVRGF